MLWRDLQSRATVQRRLQRLLQALYGGTTGRGEGGGCYAAVPSRRPAVRVQDDTAVRGASRRQSGDRDDRESVPLRRQMVGEMMLLDAQRITQLRLVPGPVVVWVEHVIMAQTALHLARESGFAPNSSSRTPRIPPGIRAGYLALSGSRVPHSAEDVCKQQCHTVLPLPASRSYWGLISVLEAHIHPAIAWVVATWHSCAVTG